MNIRYQKPLTPDDKPETRSRVGKKQMKPRQNILRLKKKTLKDAGLSKDLCETSHKNNIKIRYQKLLTPDNKPETRSRDRKKPEFKTQMEPHLNILKFKKKTSEIKKKHQIETCSNLDQEQKDTIDSSSQTSNTAITLSKLVQEKDMMDLSPQPSNIENILPNFEQDEQKNRMDLSPQPSNVNITLSNYGQEAQNLMDLSPQPSNVDTTLSNRGQEEQDLMDLYPRSLNTDTTLSNHSQEEQDLMVLSPRPLNTETTLPNFKQEGQEHVMNLPLQPSNVDSFLQVLLFNLGQEDIMNQFFQSNLAQEEDIMGLSLQPSNTENILPNFEQEEQKNGMDLSPQPSNIDTTLSNRGQEEQDLMVLSSRPLNVDTTLLNFEQEGQEHVMDFPFQPSNVNSFFQFPLFNLGQEDIMNQFSQSSNASQSSNTKTTSFNLSVSTKLTYSSLADESREFEPAIPGTFCNDEFCIPPLQDKASFDPSYLYFEKNCEGCQQFMSEDNSNVIASTTAFQIKF
ncbi:14835_t:CDS:2 [Dentiscutata erythropus]|uniref:14835_t:CDS:1 n=1 Tax=Dentiscutata erythropus TaxID=1348616 RepID=A0A9N9EPW6_9GLOM|nr:14835_t:CDS:2 [Dentiscutata erythropus]